MAEPGMGSGFVPRVPSLPLQPSAHVCSTSLLVSLCNSLVPCFVLWIFLPLN